MAVTGLKLFGVAALARRNGGPLAPDTATVPVRELAAIVRPAPFERVEMSDREVEEYQHVVEAVFERHTIVPAPFGVLFRSRQQLQRWLEMHYIVLTEAIQLVEGRCEVRVHIRAAGEAEAEQEHSAEANAAAADAFRVLRRQAAAAVPLRTQESHTVLSGAFLVDRTHWEEFAQQVAEQAKRLEGLRLEQTGPWPPYDFVRMDLGG